VFGLGCYAACECRWSEAGPIFLQSFVIGGTGTLTVTPQTLQIYCNPQLEEQAATNRTAPSAPCACLVHNNSTASLYKNLIWETLM
jgi:hypothetical protein